MEPNHETADTEAAPRKRVPRAVWWILAASAVIKLALIGPVADLPQKADERQYVAAARTINEEGAPRYPNPNWDEAHPGPAEPGPLNRRTTWPFASRTVRISRGSTSRSSARSSSQLG